MRKSLQPLLATVLCLLVAAPVAAAESGGATIQTVTGTLTTVHLDDFGTGREHEQYLLASGGAHYEIAFADGGPGTLSGATVTVTGTLEGRTLHVASSTAAGSYRVRSVAPPATGARTATAATTESAAVAKSFAAILVNFTDLHTQPYTTSAIASALYGSATSLKAYYQEESKGRMTVSGQVFGWYTIQAATTGCDWSTWVTLAQNAATAAGANLAAFTNVMVIFPNTSACGWAGLGYVGGGVSLLNGTSSVQVMTHEAGHNFGLGHANGYDCTSGGARVAIAATGSCTVNPYADPFSTMGNNALRHNQGSQLGELGWLTDAEKVVGTPGHSYTITSYLGPDGVKLVRVPRGDGSFFDLDVRSSSGPFDTFAAGSPAVSGVTIRLGVGTASPTRSPQGTSLIDTTPATTSFADAPLLVGRTLTDPVSRISFTTMSISSAGVVVRVREGIAPSAPASVDATAADDASSVALTWGAATDNVAVGSYRVARNGTTLATVDSTVSAWSDTSVAGATTYGYTVTALDTSGNAGPAVADSVTTPAGASPAPTPTPDPSATPDTQDPSQPDPVTGSATASTVLLTWGASSDDVGVAGYVITRNGATITTAAGTAWKDTARAPRTTFTYTIAAVDGAGHRSPAASVTVTTAADTTPPSRPGHFRVVRRTGSHVTFAWTRSTDNVGVIRYYIYRVGRAKPLTWTTKTSIRISTVRGARYYVRAIDAAHNHGAMSYRVRGR
jgi:chitodextrinase